MMQFSQKKRNTKIIIFFIMTFLSCKNIEDLKHVKGNLYKNDKGEIFMKLSNKGVMHPALKDTWKDTIYRKTFYYKYDSIIDLKDIINIEKYHILIPDAKFSDDKYIFESDFYQPGERKYRITIKK